MRTHVIIYAVIVMRGFYCLVFASGEFQSWLVAQLFVFCHNINAMEENSIIQITVKENTDKQLIKVDSVRNKKNIKMCILLQWH